MVLVAVLALIVWVGSSMMGNTLGIDSGYNVSPGMMSTDAIPDMIIYNDQGKKSSVEDTREFMKTSYTGTLKTRDVSGVTRDSEEIIRNSGGRVDSLNKTDKSGYISFVIPKSNLFEFKYQIEQLTHKKLYVEGSSSINLLNQKQGIENRTEDANETLYRLEAQKEELDSAHAQRISSLNSQIFNLESSIDTLTSQIPAVDDATDSEIAWYESQIAGMQSQLSQLKRDKSNENNSYNSQSSNLLSRIGNAENRLDMLDEEDQDFTENIETVNGTLRIQWISIWNLVKEFSPIPMGINVLILTILCWRILQKIKIIPRFRVV